MRKNWILSLAAGTLVLCGMLVLVPSSEAKPKKKLDPTALFNQIDTNKDGKISKEEWQTFQAAKAAARVAKGKKAGNGKRAAKVFAKLDTNNDGFLTLDEFKQITALKKGKKKQN